MHERYADLHDVLRAGASADTELRDLWDTSERERRVGAGFVVDALMSKSPLRPGLDRDSAVDVLWAMTSSETFQRLVGARGWSLERYETWLAEIFIDQLLPRRSQSRARPGR
jgi:hypothetical protein